MTVKRSIGKISWESESGTVFLILKNRQGRGYSDGTDDRGSERAGFHLCRPLPRFFSGRRREGTSGVKRKMVATGNAVKGES